MTTIRNIKIGKYRHYKGKDYQVIEVATHSETLESLVVYRALYGKKKLWVRPLTEFKEKVKWEGGTVLRFKFID